MSDLSIREFLLEVRREALHILAECDNNLDIAYREAEHRVMMRNAEALEVDHFEVHILDTVEMLSPRDADPVPTMRLCVEMGMPYTTMVYHLTKLERKRLLHRPRGERSGWKIA